MDMLRRSGGSECAGRGNQFVADADFAGARLDEAGDQPQRRGLAAARRAEQAHQLAVLDGQRYVVHHRDVAIALGQATQFNRRHANPPLIFLNPSPLSGEWDYFFKSR